MSSLFQTSSSFGQPIAMPTISPIRKELKRVVSAPSVPSKDDLERWYRMVNDMRESTGEVDQIRELDDLRDEIYAFLH